MEAYFSEHIQRTITTPNDNDVINHIVWCWDYNQEVHSIGTSF
ncbi:hypothetical protein WL385_10665 [Staphylococcus epidermidis]|nr:hypothetical protein [Staphylococcus epidermidis]